MSSTTESNNAETFYHGTNRISTLRAHPHGLEVLKFYVKLKQAEQAKHCTPYVEMVANELQQMVINRNTTRISKKLRTVLSVTKNDIDNCTEITKKLQESNHDG
jgi:hypothetical protein